MKKMRMNWIWRAMWAAVSASLLGTGAVLYSQQMLSHRLGFLMNEPAGIWPFIATFVGVLIPSILAIYFYHVITDTFSQKDGG